MKILKLLVGLLLLPACVSVTRALGSLLLAIAPGDPRNIPLPILWLLGGFAFWMILFLALPRPTRTYVLAHELTHAIWGMLMGARVSKIKVSSKGGYVTLSKTNFLIGLAPYFFPFYTMCVIALHAVLAYFVDMRHYELFWLAAIGLTWSFHLTFTIVTLMQHQPDIAEHGKVFSYAVIYLMNAIGIGLWIVAVTPVRLTALSSDVMRETAWAYLASWHGLQWLWFRARDLVR